MRKYRTFSEVTTEYYREHPEEIDDFLKVTFEEYARDNNIGALLLALQIVSRVKGVSVTAETAGISRKWLQKAFSENENLRFASDQSLYDAGDSLELKNPG